MANQHLIEVENLKMYFKKVRGVIRQKVSYVKAVDNVSFFIDRGETFGLVGESGCGKTTTGRAISRLYEPTDGTVRYDGADITHLSAREFMAYRKKIQMIFQDPYASLNPRMTVADIVGEPLDIHHICSGKAREEYILDLLSRVGLNKDHASRYPHEFSGGQRQRVGIARALVPNLLSAMSPSRPWMSRSRHRSLICWRICRSRWGLLISLSPMTFQWYGIFRTVWASCIWEAWWR